MTWRTQTDLDVLRAQRRRTVSPNGLFRPRRAQFAAWMRQPAGTQLADGVYDRARDVADFFLQARVAVEGLVARRVGLVVADACGRAAR